MEYKFSLISMAKCVQLFPSTFSVVIYGVSGRREQRSALADLIGSLRPARQLAPLPRGVGA